MTNATDGEGASLWTRLRRRKVGQWGVAYVAGAWGFLQGLQYVSGLLNWPPQLQKLAGLALLIGLPIALVLAWYHGDKGQQRVTRVELAILTVLFLIGGALFWRYEHTAQSSSTAAATTAPAAAAIPTDHSIAVLPFINMTDDKANGYFADGISEELLNLLAQVPQLRVIARTSSFSFKGKEADVATIARTLNVANLLEGSVRKSGDTLRITAQLIRASDSSHLWSQTYDRQMTDVFKVQDEIAAAVVAQLKIKLLGAAPKATVVDPRAYALYLQARQLGLQTTSEGFEQSIALYKQALTIDPNYAAAWTGLAQNYMYQAESALRPIDEGFRLSHEAVNKALAIDPESAPAHAQLGWIAMDYDRDLAAAAQYFEHALELDPTNTDITRGPAILARNLGRFDTAIALNEYVTAHDPVNPSGHANLGYVYSWAGRYDEAIASLRTALSLSPGHVAAQFYIGEALLLKGDVQGGLAAIQQESSEVWRLIGLPMAWHALGKNAESDAALAELIRKYGNDAAYNIAYVFAYRGEADRAFEWLDKAAAYRDPGLSDVAVEPLFASLHSDPRWLPFLRKLGMAPEQLAAIKFDVKLPN